MVSYAYIDGAAQFTPTSNGMYFATFYGDYNHGGIKASLTQIPKFSTPTDSGGKTSDAYPGTAKVDKYKGTAGNDMMYGLAGNDQLSGGAGDDTLIGGAGSDKLVGGRGADAFVFDVVAIKSVDKVTDFKTSEGDTFEFDASVFTSLASGIGEENVLIGKKVRAAKTSDQFLILDKVGGKLYYDADGNGTEHKAVQIAGINKAGLGGIDYSSFALFVG